MHVKPTGLGNPPLSFRQKVLAVLVLGSIYGGVGWWIVEVMR